MNIEYELTYPGSKLLPFLPDESAKERHLRRHDHAQAHIDVVIRWSEEHDITFYCTGERSNCWWFRVERGFFYWCTTTGRVVLCCDTRSQPHRHGKCYDYLQMLELADWWYQGTEQGSGSLTMAS